MTIIRLLFIWLQIRALEATVAGQTDVLPLIQDPETAARVTMAREGYLSEIIDLKAEWRRLRRGEGVRRVRQA